MSTQELNAVVESGASARRSEQSYFDNPAFAEVAPFDKEQALMEWHANACAWSAGWLRQDEGQDQAIAALMALRCW